jgi:hypothetical protein
MPFLLRPKVKWNALTAGFKTDSSVPVSEKTSKKSNRLKEFLTMNSTDTTTSNFTLQPRKSLICGSKEP